MMNMQPRDDTRSFQWVPRPETFAFLRTILSRFLEACPDAAELARRMHALTGTRFIDWIDYIRLNSRAQESERLEAAGYSPAGNCSDGTLFTNDTGVFPPVYVWEGVTETGIKVESITDFLAANNLHREVTGDVASALRICTVFTGRDSAMKAVERHGVSGISPKDSSPGDLAARLAHLERFRTRKRDFEDDAEGFELSNRIIDDAVSDLGRDIACDLWFAAEREYWTRRNRAAQVQKARQDRLGLGWANHDHHTYRSSRRNFSRLVSTWEKLGFYCRERFYAGREAGWGAQVMEHPVTRIVTFNDVDLTPDELMGDFSHEGLQEQTRLGTVGLWCGLHGDSFLQSGMHHLEAMFDFDSLVSQLSEEAGIRTMKPFTDYPYLRQAFTEGERWKVNPARIEKLLNAGRITGEQAAQFLANGAIGSHLENLERNDGFKGFSQTGVSEIISATDPRKHTGS